MVTPGTSAVNGGVGAARPAVRHCHIHTRGGMGAPLLDKRRAIATFMSAYESKSALTSKSEFLT